MHGKMNTVETEYSRDTWKSKQRMDYGGYLPIICSQGRQKWSIAQKRPPHYIPMQKVYPSILGEIPPLQRTFYLQLWRPFYFNYANISPAAGSDSVLLPMRIMKFYQFVAKIVNFQLKYSQNNPQKIVWLLERIFKGWEAGRHTCIIEGRQRETSKNENMDI